MALYHYTNVSAVLAILTNAELHFTHFNHMNDASELTFGIESYIRNLQAVLKNDEEGFTKSGAHHIVNSLASHLSHLQTVIKEEGPSCAPFFLCSFSKVPDLLSQWRGYGLYALEFDDEVLEATNAVNLVPCVYSPSAHYDETRSHFLHVLAEQLDEFEGKEFVPVHELAKKLVFQAMCRSSGLKNSAFSEEQEVRALLSGGPLHHKVRGNMLVPYKSYKFDRTLVKSVTVGPMAHQEQAVDSLKSFLRSLPGKPAIDVKTSHIPYRNY